MYFRLSLPSPFAWSYTHAYLTRSDKEKLFFMEEDWLFRKLPTSYGSHLIRLQVKETTKTVEVEILHTDLSEHEAIEESTRFIQDWFDLSTDLKPFYEMGEKDPLIGSAVRANRGLRIVGVPDLLECMAGTILGQQVNVSFAYTLKNRLIEQYGESTSWEGHDYWQFPKAEVLAALQPEVLRPLSISQRKAAYIIGFARLISEGRISKESLQGFDTAEEASKALTDIRGVGIWTANYILLRCLRYTDAYPIGDAALHNAVRDRLGMDRKPSKEEMEEVAKAWKGWEAYATYYLWYGTGEA